MKTNFVFVLALLAAGFLSACASTDSSNIKTSGLYISYTIDNVSGESAALATAIFQVGSFTGTYLSLVGGDTIKCNGVPLSKSTGLLGDISYTGNVTHETNGTYVFAFNRADEGIYTSVATLPAAVIISSPASGASSTKGNAISVQWNSAACDYLTIKLTKILSGGNSIFSNTESNGDVSSYTIPGSRTTTEAAGTTAAKIKVTRNKSGQLHSAHNGLIYGSEAQEISINLVD